MPRSAPSRADRQLLDELAAAGLPCSQHKLERWRQHGLLPRAAVRHPGGGGSVSELPEDTLDAAALLSACARPGVAWQWLGLVLAEAGHRLPDATLRRCLIWLLDAEERATTRYVAKVGARLEAERRPAPDELDLAEAIAGVVRGSRAERAYFRMNAPILAERYPDLGRRERYDLMRVGMIWNVAERLGEELAADTKAAAQGWLSEADAVQGGYADDQEPARVTFEDRQEAAATATSAEYSRVLENAIEVFGDLGMDVADGAMSLAVLRAITQLRVALLGDPSLALGPDDLARLRGGGQPDGG